MLLTDTADTACSWTLAPSGALEDADGGFGLCMALLAINASHTYTFHHTSSNVQATE